ncbi:MAG: STAS domain-containing protein [Actinomycetes bacterium]
MRSAQATLAVDVRPDHAEPGVVQIRLDGELDMTSSPLLQTVVEQVLARRHPRCTRIAIDMSGVSFADASGLSPILLARAMMSRRGGQVELRHCRRVVLRLLRILAVDDLYPQTG